MNRSNNIENKRVNNNSASVDLEHSRYIERTEVAGYISNYTYSKLPYIRAVINEKNSNYHGKLKIGNFKRNRKCIDLQGLSSLRDSI